MTIFKIIVTIFVFFAVSRVLIRFKKGEIEPREGMIWVLIWGGIELIVWIPKFLDEIARRIGVGRGIDAVVYGAIVILFYFVYRVYMKTEFIEKEITNLVRKLIIKDKLR